MSAHIVTPRGPQKLRFTPPTSRGASWCPDQNHWMTLFDPERCRTMHEMTTVLLKSGFLSQSVNTVEKVIAILI